MSVTDHRLFKQACYIDDKWIDDTKDQIEINNPADNNSLGSVPNCGEQEAALAIDAAERAFSAWSAKPVHERSQVLKKWADLIDENKDTLAKLMTLEQGKPLTESLGEMDYANSFIRWFAAEAKRADGDIIPAKSSSQRVLVLKQPVGVVAAITPWNFPAAMITRKIAPALAVGCTVVVKPDSQTPFTALALAALAQEAGFPAGVINVLTGDSEGIGSELCRNSKVRKLSFTGSTKVGQLLMEQCAPTIKKLSLELGGNAPFIVFDDADIDKAVQGAIASKFRNAGQTCVCANRLLVQDKIYDEFAKRLKAEVQKLKVGDGLSKEVDQGPLINQKAVEKVEEHIQDALDKGAKLTLGGKRHELGATFFEPTILVDVDDSMKLSQEETFGPVAGLFRFKEEKEVIAMANATQYGLASYFYTQDANRIWRVSEALEYGMVGINSGLISSEVAPFGGVKESGVGREGSKYGLEEYLELKYLCWQLT